MANEDVDDVFKDFENKVEDKKEPRLKKVKEIFKKPKKDKEISKDDLEKKRYEEEKKTLKEKYKKEMRALEEKRQKELIKEGKHPKSFATIERIAYIAVILVLVAYIVVDLSFYHGKENVSVVNEEEAIESMVAETAEENETAEVEKKVEEEEIKPVEESAGKKLLSGKITFTLDKITTEVSDTDDDLGYINSVTFTIDNGKDKVLNPLVHVYAYDSELDESWETRSRGEYTYPVGIKPGSKVTGSIDLSPRTFRNLDMGKTVRAELNDTIDGFIAADSDTVSIS